MNKNDRPKAFGVFSPVGHVIASFPSAQDADAAVKALADAGFAQDDVVRYTPEQMKAQVESDLGKASPLAALGQEINLVRAHGELADRGYSFLVIHAPKEDQAHRVAEIVKPFKAERAQRYGRFIIEEMIEDHNDEQQVFESPSRGLDAQTPSGEEEERAAVKAR